MSRERGNPLRPVCDGCHRRWYGCDLVSWSNGRKLCPECAVAESAAPSATRPVCDGCDGKWQNGWEHEVWGGGRELCESCIQARASAERFAALTPEERRAVCPKVENIEEVIDG